MTKKDWIRALKTECGRLVSALEALPEEVCVIDVNPKPGREPDESYIQIFCPDFAPEGPHTLEYQPDGTPEFSVQVGSIKVLWLGENGGKTNELST